MKKITPIILLTLLILVPLVNFSTFNMHDELFQIGRVGIYFCILMSSALVCRFVLSKTFKNTGDLYISLTVGLYFFFVLNNYAIDGFIHSLLGDSYRFRYTLMVDGMILLFIPFIAHYLLKIKDIHIAIILFAVTFISVDTFSTLYAFRPYEQSDVISLKKIMETPYGHPKKIASQKRQPNVYYILPDMFVRSDIFQKLSGMNLAIEEDLTKRSFTINHNAYSNAPTTATSLANVFSMQAVFKDKEMLDATRFKEIARIYRQGNNPVLKEFKRRGYKYYRFADGYVSHCDGKEDECYHRGRSILLQDVTFLNRTLLFDFMGHFEMFTGSFELYPGAMEPLEAINFMEQVIVKKSTKDPYFMMVHIATPHEPYRFNRECERLSDSAYSQETKRFHNSTDSKERFKIISEQTLCAETQVIKLVDWILERDPSALIVVQADHGTETQMQSNYNVHDLTQELLIENFAILSAYKLPSACSKNIYTGFSPINTFRLIFSCLDDEEPEFVADQHFAIYYGHFQMQDQEKRPIREWFPPKERTALSDRIS